MAKRRKNDNKSNWSKLGSGRQPVNGVAARVVGEGIRKPKYEQLLEEAKRTPNKDKRKSILAEARRAKREFECRIIDKAAERRARKALECARWMNQKGEW